METPLAQVMQPCLLSLAPSTSIQAAIQAMRQSQTSYILVLEKQQLAGIFTERDVVRATAAGLTKIGPAQTVTLGDLMTRQVLTLSETEIEAADIFTVLRQLQQHKIRHLPVLNEQQQVVGVITPQSIRNSLKPTDLLCLRRVTDVMTTAVIQAASSTSILELAKLMADQQVSCVVLVEADRPVGIVTERDIVQFQAQGLDFIQVQAHAVMSQPLFTVQPHDSLWQTHQHMQQLQVRRLVVVSESGALIGLVTQTCVLQVLDPVEMYGVIESLQQVIAERTVELQQAMAQQQKLAQTLADSETRYRAIVETQTELICRFLPDGTLTFVNDAYCRYYGKMRQELLGSHFAALDSPKLGNVLERILERRIASLNPQQPTATIEEKFVMANGQLCWQEWTEQAIFDEQSHLVEVQAIGRDITAQKQAEATLRQKEEYFHNAFMTAAVGMCLVSPEGFFEAVNPALCEMLGYSELELFSLSYQEITHPEDLKLTLNYVQKVLSGELSHYQLEKRYLHKQGQIIWASLSVSLARDPQQQPLHFITQIQDITTAKRLEAERQQTEETLLRARIAEATNRELEREIAERKRVEEALRQSEARYRAIVEDQTEMVTRKLPTGEHTFVNSAFCRYLGKQPEELLGRTCSELIAAEDYPHLAQHFETLNYENPVVTVEERLQLPNGEVRWQEWTARALFNEQGKLIEFQSVGRDITERKQAEATLQKWAHIFEHATWGIAVGSADGQTLEMLNPAYAQMHGYTVEELIGQPIALVFAPECQTQIAEANRFAHEQNHYIYESRHRRKDGSIFPVLIDLTAVKDQDGQVLYRAVQVQDITERKQAEVELRRSEERFRISVENLLDCFGIYSTIRDQAGQIVDFRVEYVNAAACANNGLSREQQLGKQLLELLPIHREVGLFDDYCRVIETGQSLTREVVIHRRDAEGRRYLAKAFDLSVNKLDDGFAVAWQDISERKRTEEQLRLLKSAIEQSQDAFLITEARPVDDPGPRILFANSALETITGYQPEEVVGLTPRLFQGPKTDRKQLDQIRTALQTWQASTVELVNYRKDGSEFWVELSIVPVDDGAGWYTNWLAIQRDITERKQAEALAQANHKLQQANANLSRLEKLKSELVATVSHEIRMPIATVATAIAALKSLAPQLSPEATKVLDISERESRRLARLVNSLLDFAKLDSGTYRWREEPVDLKAILLQAVQATQPLYENRHIQLHCALAEPTFEVCGDSDRLVQLVINLLDNAAKFSPMHTQVWLSLERQDQQAMVSVRDQGPGIPDEQQLNVFELFSQMQEPNGKRPRGIGLGLYLCRQIAQHHGGYLTVQSQPGQGSTFSLSLPLYFEKSLS
ncbi:PAS domain S-box protein [Leptolyngbya sp. FACHB-261]|uniref:PAS domain S-box protein n=1 Tax=Leptolyngbya sp. FACHB-261 TaxID=2692806 RepID=UPI0016839DE2|nr:PAS domain S-box protein [Leptolyngbya sp. FACHB-261]MBD2101426.1 PAS domain S-box protein [Leptolyngbya sp. FACHB-261]